MDMPYTYKTGSWEERLGIGARIMRMIEDTVEREIVIRLWEHDVPIEQILEISNLHDRSVIEIIREQRKKKKEDEGEVIN